MRLALSWLNVIVIVVVHFLCFVFVFTVLFTVLGHVSRSCFRVFGFTCVLLMCSHGFVCFTVFCLLLGAFSNNCEHGNLADVGQLVANSGGGGF